MYIYIYIYIYIYTPKPTTVGHGTRSIFKLSLTDLNSKFSLSQTGCQTRVKKPCLAYYLPIAEGRIVYSYFFQRVSTL